MQEETHRPSEDSPLSMQTDLQPELLGPPTDPPPTFSRAQIRLVDEVAIQQWGVPGTVLMENAGRGVADVMCEAGIEGRVVIACAKGNNGGDGFVIARHLHLRGFHVEVLLCCDELALDGDAQTMYAFLKRTDVPIHHLSKLGDLTEYFRNADWLVDALLGTGAHGAPRPPLDDVVRAMNATLAMRLAVDVPSGLDCDTGEYADPTFRANQTCTFVGLKNGFTKESAQPFLGEIHCLDIGIPWNAAEAIMNEVDHQKK